MESLVISTTFWKGKSVFLTGHTGFKGGWTSHWLSELGANVHGYSLQPPTKTNFFTETKLIERLASSTLADIRDYEGLEKAIHKAQPDILIHMAAQPLVRDSYIYPLDTFSSNVMGTINVLEAARQVASIRAVVNITTDKCYENKGWVWPYRESDQLGGYDPYSASKACAEIAASSYRNAYLSDSNIQLASVRAGNVIGGGDWAKDRLIPDFLRALDAGETLVIRSPDAIRPWQHVLEPISGYLILAQKLFEKGSSFAEAWNFGPSDNDSMPVSWIVKKLCEKIPRAKYEIRPDLKRHEASLLKLDSSKAQSKLGWFPRWHIETALEKTIEWHLAYRNQEDLSALTSLQIDEYLSS